MILVVREWAGAVRSYLLREPWDCSLRDKLRWIGEMDNDDNWNAEIHLDHDAKVVEMKFDRKRDDLEFTAGKRIRVQNFDEFSELFYSDTATAPSSSDTSDD